MKNTTVNLIMAIYMAIFSATAATAQMSEAQKEMIRADFNRDVLQAGDAVITADEFAPLTSSDAKVYKKWVKSHTKLIKVGDSSVVYTRATLGEQLDSGLDTFTVTNVVMPVRLLKMSTLRKTHSKDEQIPFFTFFSKDEKTERPIIILSSTTGGDKSKARALEVAMAEVRESEPAVASTNDGPKTETKSTQVEEGDEEDQDRNGESLTGIEPDMLELVQMITESTDRQFVETGLSSGFCKLGAVDVNNIIVNQRTKRDTAALQLETLDIATFRSLSTKRDTVMYSQPTFYTLKGTCGRKMYFHTYFNDGPYVFQSMPTKSKDEERIASGTEGGSEGSSTKVTDTKAPVKVDDGSTSKSGSSDVAADAGDTKSAPADTLGAIYRTGKVNNPGDGNLVTLDPNNRPILANLDKKYGWVMDEDGDMTYTGSQFLKYQFRLERIAARRGLWSGGGVFANNYGVGGFGYNQNFCNPGINYGGFNDCFGGGGYGGYYGGGYATTFAMDYNGGCTGFLHSGPMWARRQCYGFDYQNDCSSCYTDNSISVGANASVWIGAGVGTGYRNASVGDGDVESEPLVVRYNDEGMKKMVEDAKAKAKASDSNKVMQSMVDQAKFNNLEAEMQKQIAQFKGREQQSKANQVMQNLVSAAREQGRVTASSKVVDRERVVSNVPAKMETIRPATKPYASARNNTKDKLNGVRPATGKTSVGKSNRTNVASNPRQNGRDSKPTINTARGNGRNANMAQGRSNGGNQSPARIKGNGKGRQQGNHQVRPTRPTKPMAQSAPRPQRESRPAQVRGGGRPPVKAQMKSNSRRNKR